MARRKSSGDVLIEVPSAHLELTTYAPVRMTLDWDELKRLKGGRPKGSGFSTLEKERMIARACEILRRAKPPRRRTR
ncbi:MAG TPA: hypothetical protein VKN18_03565 [Blastocatellia bacterium]|nr:hypothetical protein [Blastocatellia bacterium]